MRQHSAGGLGHSPTSEESDRLLDQRARSVGAKRISLSIACLSYRKFLINVVIGKLFLSEKLKIGSKLKEKALKIFR